MTFSPLQITCKLLLCVCALWWGLLGACEAGYDPDDAGETAAQLLTSDARQALAISADFMESVEGVNADVRLLRGSIRLRQGDAELEAETGVLFLQAEGAATLVRAFVEQCTLTTRDGVSFRAWREVRFLAASEPQIDVRVIGRPVSATHPLYQRALTVPTGQPLRTASQLQLQLNNPSDGGSSGAAGGDLPAGRRVRIRPRSSQPIQFESFEDTGTVPAEQVYQFSGGVNILVEGVQFDIRGTPISPGIIDISADRIVVWTDADSGDELNSGSLVVQSADQKFQLYLEGNIVIRHRRNVVTATHAFLDAATSRALLMNSELRAYVPTTGGYFRVRAERIRQLSQDRFHAQNAWATTSPYGKPGYRLQASDVFVEPGMDTPWTGIDPLTGQVQSGPTTWVTSLNNQFVLGDIPLLWLPRISGPIEDPGIPIRSASFGQDRIFGVQAQTVWDLHKLLGVDKQDGVEAGLVLGGMTERGLQAGVEAEYKGRNQYGDYQGQGNLMYQHDRGTDNLGLDRRRLQPDSEHRGEVTWRHRQQLPQGGLLFGEIGFLSDRNYLEQYDEARWNSEKDVETVLGIRQDLGAYSGMLWTRPELSPHEASTEWLPRADLYSFSKSLLGGAAYWSSHSSAGYAELNPLGRPDDLSDPFTPLGQPWMQDANGVVAMTRHEFTAPFRLGPVSFDPFVMGEAAYWDEGLNGADSLDRYLLNAGLRARLAATKVMPFVRSRFFNLNGLAHKSETLLEYSWTDVSRGLNQVAQYNELNENPEERFQARYPLQIFPGIVPGQFDTRNYAVRQGAGLWVSAPWHEAVDDQQVLRLRFRNRLQTKVGPADSQRIRDWITWETGLSWFPDEDRDNFGEQFGLLYGNYRWNISDRTALLADAQWDLFQDSQKVWSVGLLSQRSQRGSLYFAYRQVEAGRYLDSATVISSYSYLMSPKWISTASWAYDVAQSEARGSSLTFSRVGLDFVVHFGFSFDASKDNVGVALAVEPRFGPPSPANLGYLLGLQ